MSTFSDDILKAALEIADEELRDSEYDIECPFCHKPFSAKEGLNTCPHCNEQVNLNLDIDIE